MNIHKVAILNYAKIVLCTNNSYVKIFLKKSYIGRGSCIASTINKSNKLMKKLNSNSRERYFSFFKSGLFKDNSSIVMLDEIYYIKSCNK